MANREQERQIGASRGTVVAPELPENMEWLNTPEALRLKDLRGKVVLLDFWTYCCISCLHVAAGLKELEGRYHRELVVIGVHSAKFLAEQPTEKIRQAVLRYGIRHPVVNDSSMEIWRRYAVRAWPTLVLIDPEGRIVTRLSGEAVHDALNDAIAAVIRTFEAEGRIDRAPLDLRPETAAKTTLAFPGKVLADEAGGRLFIADSNHNRVVVTDLGGCTRRVIGSSGAGLSDGPFSSAQFSRPQGMAVSGELLYVADTDNHTIRLVDLKAAEVTTIAGTGRQARRQNVPGPPQSTDLNSPWDLILHEGALYIAMAGAHQIWRLALSGGQAVPFAGSGREARIDGPAGVAALAQPSGLTTDGMKLYFADSETSSIRSVHLAGDPRVGTIAGGDLFDFGDNDGMGLVARFQHPLGVAWHGGALYVADTYNNKIKHISLADQFSRVFVGTGERGGRDGHRATFHEPAGLSIAGETLYVADTNNHLVRTVDLKSAVTRTLAITGLGNG